MFYHRSFDLTGTIWRLIVVRLQRIINTGPTKSPIAVQKLVWATVCPFWPFTTIHMLSFLRCIPAFIKK